MRLKGVIFDLDGTLGDTLPVCIAAYKYAFEKFLGQRYKEYEIKSFFGPNEEGIIRKIVPDQWQECLYLYLDAYEKAHELCKEPFSGIEKVLQLLKRRGIALAIITGKGKYSAEISIKYLRLEHYFDIVETGSKEGDVKPLKIREVLARWNLNPGHVAYVGDSPSDMDAAKQTGVVPLGAAWAKAADIDTLIERSPFAVFRSVDSFSAWMESNT